MYLHFFFNRDVKRNWGQVKSHCYGIFLSFKISKMPPRGRGPIWQGDFIHFWEELGDMPEGPPLAASPLHLRGIPTALLVVTEGQGVPSLLVAGSSQGGADGQCRTWSFALFPGSGN